MIHILQIETINVCNAKCKFCAVPHQKVKRPPMTDEVFRRIIDSAADYKVETVMPFLNGEPLLDKGLISKLKYVNEKLPSSSVVFYSNGNLLTAEKAKELSEIKNLGINFSVNHVLEEGRQAIMGLPLAPAIDNILNFKEICPDAKVGVSAVMNTSYMTPSQMGEFVEEWRSAKIQASLFNDGNWAGKLRPSYNVSGSCSRPDTTLTFLSTGDSCLCCYDIDGIVSFGSIKDKSIEQIWNSEELERYRFLNDAGRRKELKLCGSCTTG